jgi:hypothetical protein
VASKLSLFFAELKRRKVYQVGAVYVVVGRCCMARSREQIPPFPRGTHVTRTLSVLPSLVIVLRILQASLTSTRWLTRDRLLILWPRILLYRNTAFSTKLRLL